ncbi:MAG: VTT domain-containing protein [Candidatus Woesearchaeota archaeon]
MRKIRKRYIVFVLLLIFIILWSILIYFKHPGEIIRMVGVKNGYIISFFVGLFGGAATFTAIIYYPVLGTLAAGGLHPLVLALIAGAGMTIGQSIYFYFGYTGRAVLSEKNQARMDKVRVWIHKKPEFLVRALIFLYVGFTPLPNNLLTASGGIIDYPFKKIIWPLLLGNIIMTAMVTQIVAFSLA